MVRSWDFILSNNALVVHWKFLSGAMVSFACKIENDGYVFIRRKNSMVKEWKQRDQKGGHCCSESRTWVRMEVGKMDGFYVYLRC